MVRFLTLTVLASALTFGAARAQDVPLSAPPPPMTEGGSALLERMVRINQGLRSAKADVHVNVAFKTFPYIKHQLDGAYYYKQPDKQAAVFDTVPALASQFKKVFPYVEPPAAWPRSYTYGVASEDNGTTVFRLVPIKNSRIEHLDVRVDDATATIQGYVWQYKDGGSISIDQRLSLTGGNYLMIEEIGHIDLPAYKAETTAEFSNYKVNVSVDDNVFAQ